jgi:hypothetical protein
MKQQGTKRMPVFTLRAVPAELRQGLAAVAQDHPARLRGGPGAWALVFQRDRALPVDGYAAVAEGRAISVRYGSISCAFRALGRLLAENAAALPRLHLAETSALTMRGLMIDCSRNAVPRPEALKAFMRRAALMGVNMVMLYTEDTYEVPGEPFFGYLRGRYTRRELEDLDDYAYALGIEMIPCIQTLAHLEQMLQWDPYFPLRDTPGILLADAEETYTFIRKLIKAAKAPFRSRRIHIGMDEAHGLGSGRYRLRFGERRPFDIINAHLARVQAICREEGLRPMIWSDMYFRLGSKTHDYYDLKWQIPADVIRQIPRETQLVYWDYYHEDPAFYRKMIANHRKLGSEPVMGGGIWTWNIQWCALHWAFTAVKACLTACRQEGLKEVFMTLWGDDGAECDLFSALPGIQYFCELAFNPRADLDSARRGFNAVCGSEFNAWVRAADINTVPLVKKPELSSTNTAKSLLYDDPLLAVFDAHANAKMNLAPHYAALAAQLRTAARGGGLSAHLLYPALIAEALAAKVNLRQRLAAAYKAGDRRALRALRDRELRTTRNAVAALWKHHRALWMANNKPFGWETLEHRYGGLLARFDTVRDRLTDYLNGRIDAIPELAEKILDPWAHIKDTVVPVGYGRVKTPSCIK